jgi:putative transposase
MKQCGLTTRQIQEHPADIDAVAVFPELIIRITDEVKELASEWRNSWNEVIPFFNFSPEIRKAEYTTNEIESVNYTIQRIIKHRHPFPNDETVMKLIFMDLKNSYNRWTMPIRDWGATLNQLAIIYRERRVPL